MHKKIVMVTGSDGFIGKHLVKALKDRSLPVYEFDKGKGRDICRKNSFSYFLDKRIGVVFHLAGKTCVPESWDNADEFYRINTLGTQHVLEFCRHTKARFIYLSAYVYGIPEYLPIDENHPIKPNNPYAHSKWLAENLCRLYAQVWGVKATVLRPFNIFGPGQRECFLIPMLLAQVKKQGKIVVNDETPKRDYLYVDDLIQACLLSMRCSGDFNVFNIGYGKAFSVREVIKSISQCYGKNIPWKSLRLPRKNEIPETVADCSLIKKALGWKPKVRFKEGIYKTMKLA